ncbi:glycosyltransferase family 4 protein [Candidatus Azambacteria bacterium]|nr:glycosyltransferase family 4 protein [Candidatus Azambacteria bacterium]
MANKVIHKKIGIECENLEGKRFGVGNTMAQLLDAITKAPDIKKEFRFVLYFKNEIPKDDFLNDSIFEKKIIKFPLLPPSFNIFYHILIPFYSLKDKIDIFFFPSYMLPAFFLGKAVVVLTNDVYYEAHFGSLPFRYRLSYRLFCKWAALRAKKIMTISEFSKKELMDFYGLKEKKIFVNYWGLPEFFKELEKSVYNLQKISKIKEKFGIKDKYILSVGQAFERRRVKEAMLAFERIAEKSPNIQYLVPCIDKNNPPVLDALAEQINKKFGREAIIRAGYIDKDEMIYLLNFAEFLIYVSDKEALGLPPVEALKCGTPAVVADNGLTREIFKDSAFFVKDAKNIETFASTLEYALTDKEKIQKIRSEKEDILLKFNWEEHAKKLLSIFKEI